MESTDHILSKMREPSCFKGKIPVERVDADFRDFADRLDAAIKREREAGGNSAALREALEAVVKVGYPHNFQREAPHIRGYCYEITTAIEKCFAALSAPARNCDRFKTKEEAALAYAKECNAFIPQSILWQMGEWLDWLFAEAKGGANG